MGEPDLSGFDDCVGPTDAYPSGYAEIDSDSDEHIAQTLWHALATPRGHDREDEDGQSWWGVLTGLVQTSERVAVGAAQGLANSIANTLEDVDPRIASMTIRVLGVTSGVLRYAADITRSDGRTFTAEPPATLPQDEDATEDPVPMPDANTLLFSDFLTSTRIQPAWMLGRRASVILSTIGTVFDAMQQVLVDGLQQDFPDYCDEGALPFKSRDFGITFGQYESAESKRARLKLWLPTRRRHGVTFSILEQVQAYFAPAAPRIHIVEHRPVGAITSRPSRAIWSTREPDKTERTTITSPSNWDIDSEDDSDERPLRLADRDPRLYLVIEQPDAADDYFDARTSGQAAAPDLASKNGVVTPGGAGIPAGVFGDFRTMLRQWKAAGSYVAGVFVYFGEIDPSGSGALYPDGRWFDPLNDAGDGNRIDATWRVLYLDRFPFNHEPAEPAPYEV